MPKVKIIETAKQTLLSRVEEKTANQRRRRATVDFLPVSRKYLTDNILLIPRR